MDTYKIVGLMSGTSLDGLDIAYCEFQLVDGKWDYKISKAITVSYPEPLFKQLKSATLLTGVELSLLNVDLGVFFGEQVKRFLQQYQLSAHFVSSHGHTVFHQPEKSLTLQIGSPAHIAATSGLMVIADFRTGDVARGGNGAPLVPIGDELLFGEYDVCLNLGGIANLSYRRLATRLAFDVCPFNMVFNYLSQQLGKTFDEDGRITATGVVHNQLLDKLNALDFYNRSGPKSLGWEWVKCAVIDELDNTPINVADKMATFSAHAVQQIKLSLTSDVRNVMITGGGSYHQYFIKELRKSIPLIDVLVPSDVIIQYKEALIFAFLGLLRFKGEVNCLASVTGAGSDSISGAVYL